VIKIRFWVLALLILPFSLTSQDFQSLSPFSFLIGSWQGVESGVAGDGVGFRTYVWKLNNNYIMLENASHFPKSKTKPKGEVHRDIAIMSYNSNDSSIVLREFHSEGFSNIYVLDKTLSGDSVYTFISREIENNPGEWIARLTLKKISDLEFLEIFEIATDAKNFKVWLRNHWYKVE